jgi:hypothetical protein
MVEEKGISDYFAECSQLCDWGAKCAVLSSDADGLRHPSAWAGREPSGLAAGKRHHAVREAA